jgi:hypothetical protein
MKSRLLASIKKAEAVLKYKSVMDFEKGLKMTHECFKNNWRIIDASAESG